MRNLKKVLSLALALVMLLGMMMVGAGAVDTVAADIADNHKEAATVLNAVKVVEGDSNGNMNGGGNLSRADATILIVRIKYGLDVEKLLRANPVDTGFNDVSRNHYASGVIAHCVSQDIVHGINDTTFSPNGNITGIDFATLVMQALGIEGDYGSGSGRASKVLVALRENGLDDQVVVTSAPITRETAFQLMFNAITKYSPSGANGYVLMDGDKRAEAYKSVIFPTLNDAVLAKLASGTGANDWTIEAHTADDTLANTVFGLSAGTKPDAFGRTLKTWNVKGVKDPVYVSDTPVGAAATYTTKQDLKADDVKFVTGGADVYQNSAKKTGTVGSAAGLNDLTNNGVRVDVYKNAAGEINKVVVVETSLMKISRISAKTIALTGVAGTTAKVVGEKDPCFETLSGMEKDTYLLVTIADDKIQTVVEPEVVTGVTKSNTKKGIDIDGTVYPFAKADSTVSKLPVDAAKTATIYVDAAGNAYYGTSEASPVSTVSKYVYVTAVYKTTGDYSSTGTADIDMIQGVLSDGTVVEWAVTNTTGVAAKELWKYGDPSNGKRTLSDKVASTDAAAGTIASLTTAITVDDARLTRAVDTTTLYADDVNFIYVDGGGKDLTVTNLAGVHPVATTKAIFWVGGKTEDNKTDLIKTVFVDAEAPVESEDLIFVSRTLSGSTNRYLGKDDKTALYAYDTVYLNGEKISGALFAHKSGAVENGAVGVHTYTIDEKTGAYVLGAKITTKSGAAITATDVERTSKGTYFLKKMKATDAVIVDTRSNVGTIGKITDIGELYDACQDWDFTVSYVDVDKEILYIYIEDVAVEQTVSASKEETTVAAGEKVTVNSGKTLTVTDKIEKGADITIKDLTGIKLGSEAKAEEAVKLDTTTVTSGNIKTIPVNVPVFIGTGFTGNGDVTDVSPNTIAINYTGRDTSSSTEADRKVTLSIKNASGVEVYTETFAPTKDSAANGIFYVCLDATTDAGGKASGSAVTNHKFEDGYYTATVKQGDKELTSFGFTWEA